MANLWRAKNYAVDLVMLLVLSVNAAPPTPPVPSTHPSTARAAVDPAAAAKRKDIRRLLELSGSAKLGLQMMDQMMGQFRGMMPNVPPEFWDDFRQGVDMDDLINLIVPVYERHFTHDDVRGLIAFYESDVGRKLVSVQPAILKDSMTAGEAWGRDIAARVTERLRVKGYLKQT